MKSWRVCDKVVNTRNNRAELIESVPEVAPKPKKTNRTKPKKDLPPALFD
jgi:hypothetical protein